MKLLGQDWDYFKFSKRQKSANQLIKLVNPVRLERTTYCLEGSFSLTMNLSTLYFRPHPSESVSFTNLLGLCWDKIKKQVLCLNSDQPTYRLISNSNLTRFS